jgi:uncharacterized protein YidB (DUF937 family)
LRRIQLHSESSKQKNQQPIQPARILLGSHPNKSISPADMEQALGDERVQWLMKQTGMSKDELMTGLSAKLPEVVDKLTPDGRLPTEAEAGRIVR